MVVPILFCDGTWPCWLRKIPARVLKAHLATRFTEVAVRRRDVQSERGGLRQSGSCRDHDSQLPLAAGPGRGRAEICRARKAACSEAGHHSSDQYDGKRRQRCAAPRPRCLREQVFREIRTPTHHGRDRAQPAAGGAAGLCPGRRRYRCDLIDTGGTGPSALFGPASAPAIEVHIVQNFEPPGGMEEAGTSAIVPAVTNAIFAATGKRLRKLPVDIAALKQPL